MVLPVQGLGSVVRTVDDAGNYRYGDNQSTGEKAYNDWIVIGYCEAVRAKA